MAYKSHSTLFHYSSYHRICLLFCVNVYVDDDDGGDDDDDDDDD